MQNNVIGLVLSYLYAFGLLLIIEQIGKYFRWDQANTRKIIHIAAGMWVWGILYFFKDWYWGFVPFATFIGLNYIFYKKRTFEQMDTQNSSPGTIYFAISITFLFLVFWRPGGETDLVYIAVAGVMAMTWGDAFASLIGRKWGKKKYQVFGYQRSWVGSMAMAIFSFIAIWLTLRFLPGSFASPYSIAIPLERICIYTVISTLVATISEGVTPAGLDNLTVPILTSLSLYGIELILA